MLDLIGRASAAQALPVLTYLPTYTSLKTKVGAVLQFLLIIGAILAVVFLVYGGVLYITAGGDAEKATKGRTAVINAIIGIIIIMIAYALVTWVSQLVNV